MQWTSTSGNGTSARPPRRWPIVIIAILLGFSVSPELRADDEGGLYTPRHGWYDFQSLGAHVEVTIHSLDGYRSVLRIYASDRPENTLVLLSPDFHSVSVAGLKSIIDRLRSEFHVALLIPRGKPSVDRDSFGRYRPTHKITGSIKDAKGFLFDYKAALAAITENAQLLRIKSSRTCVLAGDYYSNVLLLEALPGVDCLVLLSPDATFYRKDLPVGEIEVPTLLVATRLHVASLRPVERSVKHSAILSESGAGRGYAMLHRKDILLIRMMEFLQDPTGYVTKNRTVYTRDENTAEDRATEGVINPPAADQ